MTNSNLPPMNEEKLSQLMDGEWDGLNPSDCVAGICDDDALRSKWARYHLIRDVINSEPVEVDNKLVSSICAAIADEPTYSNITPFAASAEQASADSVSFEESSAATNDTVTDISQARDKSQAVKKSSSFGTGLTGFALAASVALVTVVGMNVYQGQESLESGNVSVAVNTPAPVDAVDVFSQQVEGAPLPEVEFVSNTGSYWVSPQTSERVTDEKRLNMFLSQHLENSPTAGREGMLSYSRLVGYDDRAEEQ